MRITVPGIPPSVNHMYAIVRMKTGRTINVPTAETKAWMEAASLTARVAANCVGWLCQPKGVKVVVNLRFFWPDLRRRDTHNALKAMLDAWEGVLYEDDSYALPRIMDWSVDKANPRIEAEIEVLGEAVA